MMIRLKQREAVENPLKNDHLSLNRPEDIQSQDICRLRRPRTLLSLRIDENERNDWKEQRT